MATLIRKQKHADSSLSLRAHLCIGFFIRFSLIVYGDHHDRTHALKYTDVDYHVLTDAARELREGNSPYARHTYRYTPLLAIICLPNTGAGQHFFLFGKFLFALCDIAATKLVHDILGDECDKRTRLRACFLWLYNPLVIAISTRGNADSIPALVILSLVALLKRRNLPALSGLFLGLAVHIKLYPIIYSLPIYLSFSSKREEDPNSFLKRLKPSKMKLKLVVGAVCGFLVPTLLSFWFYGNRYVEEAFLHHFGRTDTRHNFSVYFYLLYLCSAPGAAHSALSPLATVAPQMMVVGGLGVRYGTWKDLPFALFTQTFAFVTFNKVVTSQYFVWYLVLLALVTPRFAHTMSVLKALLLTFLWLAAQASWLLPAYLLEFEGVNSFAAIWLEGVAFFCCNVGILMALISAYESPSEVVPIHHHTTRKLR